MLGWMIVVGSVLVVVNVFEMIGGIRSLETREMLEEYLTDGPGTQLGWSVETGLQALRATAMVAAACAAAAAVLGWFVLRRNRGARLGLTVIAFPLFVTGVVAGGFMSSLVAASIVLLWVQPSRDWFDGKAPKPAVPLGRDDSGARNPFERPADTTSGDADAAAPPQPGPVPTSAPQAPTGGRPVEGFGDRPTWGAGTPTPGVSAPVTPPPAPTQPQQGQPTSPYGHARGSAYGQPGQPGTDQPAGLPEPGPQQRPPSYAPQHAAGHAAPHAPVKRPGAVWVAAVLTWVFSGLALVSSLIAVAALLLSPDTLRPEIDRMVEDLETQGGGQEVTADMLIGTTVLVGVVMAVFCLVACLAALLVVLRRSQGSVLLMITSSFTAAFCLLAAVTSMAVLLLVPAVAAVVVVVLLLRRDVRAWLKTR